jgi:hypothetical protein
MDRQAEVSNLRPPFVSYQKHLVDVATIYQTVFIATVLSQTKIMIDVGT